MKKNTFLCMCLVGIAAVSGCGKQSPLAPDVKNNKLSTQTFKPSTIAYEGVFGGPQGAKPYYWYDADNTPAFNAEIRTNGDQSTANITRVNEGTWGKVHTAGITCSNDYHKIRMFIVSHSANMTWKLTVQEEGGAWRSWVVQESTNQTGYLDYDFSSILSEVNSGGGVFTLNIIIEGNVGEYLQIGELYVYRDAALAELSETLWEEKFQWGIGQQSLLPPGWFDETNSPGLNATITKVLPIWCFLQLPSSTNVTWGKTQSPTVKGDLSVYQYLKMTVMDTDSPLRFKVALQEVGGAERLVWLSSFVSLPSDTYHTFACNTAAAVTAGFTANTEFRVEIWVEKTENDPSKTYGMTIMQMGIYQNLNPEDIIVPPAN